MKRQTKMNIGAIVAGILFAGGTYVLVDSQLNQGRSVNAMARFAVTTATKAQQAVTPAATSSSQTSKAAKPVDEKKPVKSNKASATSEAVVEEEAPKHDFENKATAEASGVAGRPVYEYLKTHKQTISREKVEDGMELLDALEDTYRADPGMMTEGEIETMKVLREAVYAEAVQGATAE